ncbi:MAG: patatin-like phospholipase family protein [Roseomonas sp.]|nr:patatin-like phospholipase family protein [Roseomonas sp.]
MGQKLEDALKITRRAALFGGAGLGLAACATPTRGPAVPIARTRDARVLGLPNERFFFPWDGDAFRTEVLAAQERARQIHGTPRRGQERTIEMLAISGGGENGAFGAGLLNGWTEAGNRPTFSLVTGVSTGALTAPFAFLGSRYDAALKAVYTDITPKDVLEQRNLLNAALFDDALADSAPLFLTISKHLNEAMLADIARAHERGRLLLIGTSDMDAQVPVAWNIGAIAASGHPGALDLVRRILLASSAVPGGFPPVMIDVMLDGKTYQEMHVDGGAFTQVFLYPRSVTRERRAHLRNGDHVQPARAYIIRNGRLTPNPARTERQTFVIAQRAIASMISASGFNDVTRIRNTTREDKVDFNLAVIGPDFQDEPKEPFEQAFMRKLYDHAYAQARVGYPWMKDVPY